MVTFIEAQVEALIVAACTGVCTDLNVVGFWDAAAEGTVKTNPRSAVSVRITPRANDTWGLPVVTLHASVSVLMDQAEDPTGALMIAAFASLSALLAGWQKDEEAASAALSIADVFRADAVLFADGGDCGYDETTGAWYATIMLDIKGCVLDAPTTETQED